MKKGVLKAAATLTGCVIGAGILGIPYVVSQAGFLTGLFDIILIGIVILFLNLFLGEIVLRTKEQHQLTGYTEKYLGRKGEMIMFFSTLVADYGALIAYMMGEGRVLSTLFGYDPLVWSFIFFVFVSILVYFGIKSTSSSEFIASSILVFIVLILGIISFGNLNFNNLTEFNIKNVGIPYGVIVFAYLGLVAVPEMREVLIKNKKEMKKAILIGSLIPIFIYTLFTIIVVGVSGVHTTQIATVGLGKVIGPSALIFGNVFAFFAMFSSFLAISLGLKEVFNYDFKLNKFISFLLATIVPLLLFLLVKDIASFTDVLNISGYLAGGVIGILVLLMTFNLKKGDRKPEYFMNKNFIIKIIIGAILIAGIIYNLIK